jgi:hypothetical protein
MKQKPEYANANRKKKISSGDNPFSNNILVEMKVTPQIITTNKTIA